MAVVRRMARDLSFPVTVVACPTVREPDGLAMSSRNVYLTPEQRAAAPVLHRALRGRRRRDPRRASATRPRSRRWWPIWCGRSRRPTSTTSRWSTRPRSRPCDPLTGEVRLLVAARFGRARLIDNVGAVAAEG